MAMNADFFQQLNNPIWKQLSFDNKQVLLQHVLRYFVNPLLSVSNIEAKHFHYGGIKTDTFEVTIDGSRFVFVPGQTDCLLGWDGGLSGLDGLDCSEERQELRYALKNYLNEYLNGYIFQSKAPSWSEITNQKLTTQEVAQTINQQTSPLREVSIPPLLVEVSPKFVGLRPIGSYSVVTGELSDSSETSQAILNQIRDLVIPDHSQDVFLQEYPRTIRTEKLFIKENKANPDLYDCYIDNPVSYQAVKEDIQRTGMGLLSEDEWEYCRGASTRRLFPWSNKLHRSLLSDLQESPLGQRNMFGLEIAAPEWGPELIEDQAYTKGDWIEEKHKAPIINLLPFSNYYRSSSPLEITNHKYLDPGYYCVRRSIRIEL